MENQLVTSEGFPSSVNPPQPPPLLHDICAAAHRLSVSPQSIRKLVRQQRLTKVPNIRKLLIPESALQQFAQTAQ